MNNVNEKRVKTIFREKSQDYQKILDEGNIIPMNEIEEQYEQASINIQEIPKNNEAEILEQEIHFGAHEKAGNAYATWTKEDDLKLRNYYEKKLTTKELQVKFNRSAGSIRSRLKKLGL